MAQEEEEFTRSEFDFRWELYKARFGSTFSYFLVTRSPNNDLKKRVYKLMQQALGYEIDPITDKELRIEIPDGADS